MFWPDTSYTTFTACARLWEDWWPRLIGFIWLCLEPIVRLERGPNRALEMHFDKSLDKDVSPVAKGPAIAYRAAQKAEGTTSWIVRKKLKSVNPGRICIAPDFTCFSLYPRRSLMNPRLKPKGCARKNKSALALKSLDKCCSGNCLRALHSELEKQLLLVLPRTCCGKALESDTLAAVCWRALEQGRPP